MEFILDSRDASDIYAESFDMDVGGVCVRKPSQEVKRIIAENIDNMILAFIIL